jgi:hypothetical protein
MNLTTWVDFVKQLCQISIKMYVLGQNWFIKLTSGRGILKPCTFKVKITNLPIVAKLGFVRKFRPKPIHQIDSRKQLGDMMFAREAHIVVPVKGAKCPEKKWRPQTRSDLKPGGANATIYADFCRKLLNFESYILLKNIALLLFTKSHFLFKFPNIWWDF